MLLCIDITKRRRRSAMAPGKRLLTPFLALLLSAFIVAYLPCILGLDITLTPAQEKTVSKTSICRNACSLLRNGEGCGGWPMGLNYDSQ